jgi:glutamine synthetase
MMDSYALTNPISLLVDKEKEQFTRHDLVDVIEKKRIERITLHYTGLDGKLKELKIPVASRYQVERILADGERVDGSSLFKGMVDTSVSDLYVIPVYKSAFMNPFDEGSLDLICRYMTKEGQLAPFAIDNVLIRAAELLRARSGLELFALGELEFFLLNTPGSKIFQAERQRGYHNAAPFLKSGQILNEMVRYITQMTGSVKYAHSEVGFVESVRSDDGEISGKMGEQLEIEFLPAPIADMGDYLVLARWIIRNVAYKYGCLATFTPKIEEGVAGSGLHVHMELRKDGQNIMKNDQGELSREAHQVIGGLCTYADSLTAFGNTVSSAYLRLVPNQEAPTRICWSDLNRSAMIRVPLGWSKKDNLAALVNPQQTDAFHETIGRQTVELRSPDGSAIVHLLLAGIAMAAEYGLSRPDEALALAEKLYVKGNIFHNKELLGSLPILPKSCVESARILLEKRELYERDGIFPPSVIAYIAKLLDAEKDEAMNQRFADMPADDRLLETRKIMHKDLHRH